VSGNRGLRVVFTVVVMFVFRVGGLSSGFSLFRVNSVVGEGGDSLFCGISFILYQLVSFLRLCVLAWAFGFSVRA
jgi:hypothetical protein